MKRTSLYLSIPMLSLALANASAHVGLRGGIVVIDAGEDVVMLEGNDNPNSVLITPGPFANEVAISGLDGTTLVARSGANQFGPVS